MKIILTGMNQLVNFSIGNANVASLEWFPKQIKEFIKMTICYSYIF